MKKQLQLLLLSMTLCTTAINAQWASTESTDWNNLDNWGGALPTIESSWKCGSFYNYSDVNLDIGDGITPAEGFTKSFRIGSLAAPGVKLTVKTGSTYTAGEWLGVGYDSSFGAFEVEVGATANITDHIWAVRSGDGPGGNAAIDIYGTLNVGGRIAFNRSGGNGTGYIRIHDGGLFNLTRINSTEAFINGCYMDIVGNGVVELDVKVDGGDGVVDFVAAMQGYADAGEIKGDGVAGFVTVMLGENGRTYVTSEAYNGPPLGGVLGLEEYAALDFSVYPNPSKNSINIQSKIVISNVKMFNLIGEKVLDINGTSRVDISAFSAGIYVLKVTDVEGHLGVKRVLKK